MAYWSFFILLLSVSLLAYRHPAAIMEFLPQWLRPAKRRPEDEDVDQILSGENVSPKQNGTLVEPEVKIEVDDAQTGVSTPKATPTEAGGDAIPTFSLDKDQDMSQTGKKKYAQESSSTPSSPTTTISQKPSSMPPPPQPRPASQRSATSLMPPPGRPVSGPRASTAGSLRVPSNGPLPNRGPPANSQQRLTVNGTATSTPNPRGKVLLSPGHSPMDWAALTRNGSLSGVSTFQRVTPSHLKTMTGRKGRPAWSSWQGKVYNITPYLPFHPGGESELMKAAGRDGTKLFMEVHPWVNWENMLGSCLVGVLVPEEYGRSELEDMD